MMQTKDPRSSQRASDIGQPVSSGRPIEERKKGSLGVGGLVLIGMGGIIGAGFFLGAGLPIRTAGPAVLLAYLIGAVVMAQVTGALASLAVNDVEQGTFVTYAKKYVGRFAGFLEGWAYYVASIMTIASESVAMAIFSHMWVTEFPMWLLSAVYAAIVIGINAWGVRNFGRVESVMSVMKLAALIGFIVCIAYLLFSHHQPVTVSGARDMPHAGQLFSRGFFANGSSGLFQSMLIVIFAYAGIGVFASATTEMRRPSDISKAAWITVIGLSALYILSIGLLLFEIPWQHISTTKSPFVSALQQTGVPLLGGAFNLIILIASFSVMAGAVFSANQILQSLGRGGQGPKFVLWTTKRGMPYGALGITTLCVGVTILISFLLPANVYNFLISASSFLTFLNWFLILWAFLGWRRQSQSGTRRISSLSFGQPVATILTMMFIVFLTVYALMQPDQRLGFYAFCGIALLLSMCYVLVPRLRRGKLD